MSAFTWLLQHGLVAIVGYASPFGAAKRGAIGVDADSRVSSMKTRVKMRRSIMGRSREREAYSKMRRGSRRVVLVAAGLLTAAAPLAAWQAGDGSVTSGSEETAVVSAAAVLARIPVPAIAVRSTAAMFLRAGTDVSVGALPVVVPDQAIEHSDAYYTRLTIHRWGSYVMLPLFAGEYLLGNELLNGSNPAGWVRPMHGVGAGALGVLFGVNTITGVWNLVESRKDPGAVRRILHSTLMLASDAGFLYTSSIRGEREDGFGRFWTEGDNRRHRDWAIGSMALSTAGTLLMWLWKD
jgi:hypothetical protein